MASRLAAIMVLNLECMKHLSETVLQRFGSQIGSIKMFLQQQRKGFIFLGTVKRILYQNKHVIIISNILIYTQVFPLENVIYCQYLETSALNTSCLNFSICFTDWCLQRKTITQGFCLVLFFCLSCITPLVELWHLHRDLLRRQVSKNFWFQNGDTIEQKATWDGEKQHSVNKNNSPHISKYHVCSRIHKTKYYFINMHIIQ